MICSIQLVKLQTHCICCSHYKIKVSTNDFALCSPQGNCKVIACCSLLHSTTETLGVFFPVTAPARQHSAISRLALYAIVKQAIEMASHFLIFGHLLVKTITVAAMSENR